MPKSKGRRKPKRTQPAPPPPKKHKESPKWYVALMFGLMAVGAIVIILNYIGAVPGGTDSKWLYSGLGAIAIGFVMTLNYY